MGLNLERLAEALRVNTTLTQGDRNKILEMRNSGRYDIESAKDEIIARKILKRISELVEKIDGKTKSNSSGC